MKPPRLFSWWEVAGLASATSGTVPGLWNPRIALRRVWSRAKSEPGGSKNLRYHYDRGNRGADFIRTCRLGQFVDRGLGRSRYNRLAAASTLDGCDASGSRRSIFPVRKPCFPRYEGGCLEFRSAALAPPILLGLRCLILLARLGGAEIS